MDGVTRWNNLVGKFSGKFWVRLLGGIFVMEFYSGKSSVGNCRWEKTIGCCIGLIGGWGAEGEGGGG